jgi:hypothetical protein
MTASDKDALYVVLFLVALVVLDLVIIGGIFVKGHANFTEVIKHLK